MNRTLSRTILGLLVVIASAIVTGVAVPPPATSGSDVIAAQAMEPPYACLLEKNIGACVRCCMEAVDAPAWACARFCKIIRFPPPPPPEPEP